MLQEPPTSVTKDFPKLTSVTSQKFSTKKPREWVSGLLLHMPRTPRHHLLPLPRPKFTPLFNAFKPCDRSNNTYNLCGEKAHWANECPIKAYYRHCQEGQGEQQANKQSWENIPPMGTESTKIVMDAPSTGAPSVCPLVVYYPLDGDAH